MKSRNAYRSHAVGLAVCAALAASAAFADTGGFSAQGSATSSLSLWEDRGSALFPKGSAARYAGSFRADLRAEAGELSRCAFEGSVAIDAASGKSSFAIRELWAELRPSPALPLALAIRAGRQRLGFGSGFVWNPSNDLDPRRDASDPTAARAGADAAQFRIEAGDSVGFPLSLTAVCLLPAFAAGVDLSDVKSGAQAYALLGPLEVMATLSVSSFGDEGESWLAGGWATLGLGPAVLGLELAARKRADLYRPGAGGLPAADREVHVAATGTATVRAGDFVIVAEAAWDDAALSRDELDAILASPARASWIPALFAPGAVGDLHSLLRATWSSGD
ncbi:MAG: hypothetical protein Q8M76_16815, partial [Spirochaetaceae bacterium]|nr:hypothetical protein [Spirochaetaceae bacterium]